MVNEVEKRRSPRTYASKREKVCCNCGSTVDVEFHHIVPLSLCGTERESNIVALCSKCHRLTHGIKSKGNHSIACKAGIERARSRGKTIGAPTRIDKEAVMETICRNSKTFSDNYMLEGDIVSMLGISSSKYHEIKRELLADCKNKKEWKHLFERPGIRRIRGGKK